MQLSCFYHSDTECIRDWGSVQIENGKIAGPKLFAPRHQDRVKLYVPPPPPLLKSGNSSRPPPPPSIWLKVQATV